MQITFTRVGKNKLNFQGERDGKVIYSWDFVATNRKAQMTVADTIGMKLEDLTPIIVAAMSDGMALRELTETVDQVEIALRGERQVSGDAKLISGEPLAALKTTLAITDFDQSNPVFSWRGTELLCCVDVDYHSLPFAARPELVELQSIASQIRPIPVVYHPSHGRGAKLYYITTKGFTAEELAACAALSWTSRDGRATVELKRESRHPLYKRIGEIRHDEAIAADEISIRGTLDTDLQAVAYMFSTEVKEENVDNWLAERGMERGKKYSHSYCPISPVENTHGEPVFVGEHGISCHKCSAMGTTYGNRRSAGFAPYTSLVNGDVSVLHHLCRGFVHYTHAEFVLRHHFGERVPRKLLQLAYRCALKLVHGIDDPRIAAVFGNHPIARVTGEWIFVGDKNGTSVSAGAKGIFAALPATWDVTRGSDGVPKCKVNGAKLDTLSHTGVNLAEYGYTELRPIRGIQMWGAKLEYSEDTIAIPDDFSRLPVDARPKYVSSYTLADVAYAWSLLEKVFPGIDRDYVEFLVAARGLVEAGIQTVYAIVTGATKAGKTTTPRVVAGLLGDRDSSVIFSRDETRFRQGIMEAVRKGSFTVVDELFKKAESYGMSARSAVDPLLTLTRDSLSHKMYAGPTPIGGDTVYIITDIELPYEIVADAQLGRRLIEIPLLGEVGDWRLSTARYGINDANQFRQVGEEYNRAADILCTYWRDKFFSEARDVNGLMALTKYKWLKDTTIYGNPDLPLKLFFELVCKAPPLIEKDLARLLGLAVPLADADKLSPEASSWKLISTSTTDDLRDTWDQLADGSSGEKWKNSRRLKEPDWSAKLRSWYVGKVPGIDDLPRGVRIQFRHYKDQAIYVRFALDKSNGTVYNEKVLINFSGD